MKISIVVPTQGNLKNLRRLLKSLQDLDGIEEAEILLAQNPPSRHLAPLLSEFPQLQLQILCCEPGVNKARNLGLDHAKGELIFFLDDDCWVTSKNWISRHRRAHEDHPWALAVGGFYRYSQGSALSKAYGDLQKEWLESNLISAEGECSTLLGGHFSMKKSLCSSARFDSSIRYGGAETEFFFRLRQRNFRYLLISSEVEHEPHLNIFLFLKKAYLQGRTHRRLLRERIFNRSLWIHRSSLQSSFYRKLYLRFFHCDFSWKGPRQWPHRLKNHLNRIHRDICFYLSNKDLF